MKLTQIVKIALKEALKAKEKGEVPIGAVVFSNNEVISKAHNLVISKKNHLAHAEILAINKATKKLKTMVLKDYKIYSTLEPCLLCSYTISKYRLNSLYFGAYDNKNGCIENGVKLFNMKFMGYRPNIYGGIGLKEHSDLIINFFKEIREKN